MKPSMIQKLEQHAQRLEDVNRLLSGDQLLKIPRRFALITASMPSSPS